MEAISKYQQTDVGLIPNDWEAVPLEFCLDLLTDFEANGSFEDVANNVSIYDFNGFAWYVRATDLENNSDLLKVKYVDELSYKFLRKTKLFGGELLITKRGEIGKVYFFIRKTEYATLAPNLYLLKLNESIIPYFAFSYFKGIGNHLLVEKNASSTLGALYKNDVKSIVIPLPPLPEQKAIATALKDTDDLIQNLEELIAKKKLIKQGAMQELLEPKEGWVTKSLFEIADNKKELFDDGDWIESEHITNQGVRLIQTGNIGIGHFVEKENKKYIYESSFERLKCKELRIGDLLICRLAEPAGRACILPNIGELKVITSVDVTIFRPRNEVANRLFLSNIFSTERWFQLINEMVGGTTHKRISRGSLGRIKISLPSIEEQNLIAIHLNDMDTEIENLEIKLSKYKTLKQGMMQQLLTGKIRLV